MIRVLKTLLFILLLHGPLLAQKESSFWINRFYSFDFNTYPPIPSGLTAASAYQSARASIADRDGKLLFYSDGLNYYDRTGTLMPNGQGISISWGTTELPFIIAPVPGNKTQFYLFNGRLPKSHDVADYDWSFHYSKIDMQLNSGKGDVVEKDVIIYPNARDEFTLIKTPDDTLGYWLVSINQSANNALVTRRVSSAGISSEPVITDFGSFINQSNFKASPDGKYLAIVTTPFFDGTHRFKILSFNGKTGAFTLHREIVSSAPENPNAYPNSDVYYSNPEFSSDSRFIYVLKDSTYSQEFGKSRTFKTLLCYDMLSNSAKSFLESKDIIFNFPEGKFPVSASMQLSPQRKIIIGDLLQSGYFSTIHNPNACNVADKNFEFKSIKVPADFFLQPARFAPWYFYEANDVASDHAGKDTVICSSQQIILGKTPQPGFKYTWDAAPGLSNLNSANPVFQAGINTTEENDSTILSLTIEDPVGCTYYGSVKVITKPVNRWTTQGSRSVCPGIKEVKYWIENDWAGKNIAWEVDGGSIVSGQNTDTILVNWGASNPTASVSAISINENNCTDILNPFPVKVFKFLEAETPSGKDNLLCNDFTEPYKILPTNGSLYEWQLTNGTILEGQGTAQVNIEWDSQSLYNKIWINESVNTDLEICFGQSDTLVVTNPHKMLSQNLSLFNISGVIGDNESLEIIYKLKNQEFYDPEIILQRRPIDSDWINAGITYSGQQQNIIPGQPLSHENSFRLLAFNVCGDSAKSSVHKNILLSGEILPENNLQLSWNQYETWESGLPSYELYRKLDAENEFAQIGIPAFNSFTAGNNTDGFVHTFYVTARSNDGLYSSLSNKLTMEFEHVLFMPNIITPNGDTKNDTWSPFPLELYPENELIIFDRWGKTVFQTKNYAGTWDGTGLSPGVYFYEFRVIRNQKHFKGFIHIVREGN